MKAKLKFIVPVPILLVVLAAAYLTVLAPKKAQARPLRVAGTLVELPDDFVVNLAGAHYGKLSIAVLLTTPPPKTAIDSAGAVHLPQDAAVRATITDVLTDVEPNVLIDRATRRALLAKLVGRLHQTTDEPISKVLITDLAVQ
jgi:flagellar basal body-associated protein FliL